MNQKKYKGLLLDQKLSDGRLSGDVFVANNCVYFSSEETLVSIPIRQVQISYGGTSNRHIYFKTSTESFTICSFDIQLLKDQSFTQNEKLQKGIVKIKNRKRIFIAGLSATIGIILLPLLGVLVFKSEIINSVSHKVPNSIEQNLGDQYIKQVSITEKLDSSSEAVQILREKALIISSQTGQKFKIYISNSQEVNAYALPGGYVVFNKGLLAKAKNWEEVLGVMGHEMAHITLKHHTRGVLSKLGWTTVLSFLLGDGGAFTDLLFGAAANLEGLSYSRSFETESDEKGLEYLTKANIKPNGLVSFFETLQKESGAAKHIPELLSTHPAAANRAENLQKIINLNIQKKYLDLGNYKNFTNKLNP